MKMSTTAPVLITVPKYITISPNPAQKIAANQSIDLSFSTSSNSVGGSDSDTSSAGRGKKRRLDHLTWEEKIQRK